MISLSSLDLATNTLMLLCGLISLLRIIQGNYSLLNISMSFMGIEAITLYFVLISPFNLKSIHIINTFEEYGFYLLTIAWVVNEANFTIKQKIAIILFSSSLILISLIAFLNKNHFIQELLLSTNYLILIIAHILNIQFVKQRKRITTQHYFALFGFFSYNIVSGLFYSINNYYILNTDLYMTVNLLLVCLSCCAWICAMLIPSKTQNLNA